ncbi:AAA domain-containing protein [Sulfitobacter marinus]|uniref:AAA domain-containing protein n=1 Tax=Sulfitobacter marinus TaxID=394264 RepID=A0A1I6VC30_9RHOB|nr:CpsD/CapB family tyrosine-protein kinase [Sulfitobacter marinus]SFT11288.1 AAA domain-containing protein [Sulfitobacter marinus]
MNVSRPLPDPPRAPVNPRLKPIPSVQETLAFHAAWDALAPCTLDPDHLSSQRIFAHNSGVDAMPYDMLRSRLIRYMADKGWRRIAITSPTAECGKSTLALNLALSLQRRRDCRSILLEMDMRRPSLADMLGVAPPIDLAHFLRGDRPFGAVALRVGDNLAIATNSVPATDAAPVLASPYLPLALNDIQKTYAPEVMILDTPPMLQSHDMMAIANHVDCVLIVAAAEVTTTQEIDQCERELSGQAEMLGVVLNKCRHQGAGIGYGGYE